MGSVAVGSLAVAAVCYFDWLLADAATILKLHQSCFVVYHMILRALWNTQQ
jgi:hypothetical protein